MASFHDIEKPVTPVVIPPVITSTHTLQQQLRHEPSIHKTSLGALLINQKLITSDELQKLLDHYGYKGREPLLSDVFRKHSAIPTESLQRIIAYKLGMPFVQLESMAIESDVLSLVPVEFAREHNLMPIMHNQDKLVIAIEEPNDPETLNLLSFVTGQVPELVVATRQDIEYAIGKYYGPYDDKDVMKDLHIPEDKNTELTTQESMKLGQQRPTVRLVHHMIMDAIHSGASDIHLRPGEHKVELFFRIDGSLVKIRSFNKNLLPSIVSRIKILGVMDIAERRLPQDGQSRINNNGRLIDLRISIMPSIHGESVVIRILDTSSGLKSLSDIGFTREDEKRFAGLLAKSAGMILVTGPTGSGKSTTLYAALKGVQSRNVNIITVEDPVEYHINGIVQIQVNPSIDYTFAEALRHILRHDPDVIMVGEVRDQETAKMAVESALTGHIVLSTLHTNSAASTITRLLEIGIEPYLINTALLAVLAQRLVRQNCPHCTEPEEINPAIRESLGIDTNEVFYKGKGCEHCHHTGYKGRRAVYELLVNNANIRQAVVSNANSDALEKMAIQHGMTPLTDQALKLARNKITSLAEVYRVRLN